jgi:hypothetical protein
VQVLGWLSAEDSEMLMQKAPEGTRFIFNLLGAPLDEAKRWLERMRATSPRI